jgi:hypothetical protein
MTAARGGQSHSPLAAIHFAKTHAAYIALSGLALLLCGPKTRSNRIFVMTRQRWTTMFLGGRGVDCH